MKFYFFITYFLLFGIAKAKAGNDTLIAYVFMAEGCPICQSITPELNAIHKKYSAGAFKLIGVFPSVLSDSLSRAEFSAKFKIRFNLIGDPAGHLSRKFNATITPEVVLVNTRNQAIVYRGLIDDSFAAVGKRRKVTKYQYLNSAIERYSTTFESSTFTEPVGCKITLKP